MSDKDFMRYSRQLLLPEVGEAGQLRLAGAHVAIIGVGGLGTLAAHYLAAAGVGAITLVDGDTVCLSNLPRQLLFNQSDVGQNKAWVAATRLAQAYPHTTLVAAPKMFDKESARDLLGSLCYAKAKSRPVVVLDCSDNFATRQGVNSFCVSHELPLCSASVAHFSGQLFAMDSTQSPMGGCYHCLFPADTQVIQNCSTAGVLGPMVGMMASMQALLALEVLLGIGDVTGYLWRLDGKRLDWRRASMVRDHHCPVCGDGQPKSAGIAMSEEVL